MADENETDNAAENEKVVGSLLERLKNSGEQVFNEFSQRLLENPTFLAALRRSVEAKDRVGRTISGTMDFVNLPSKNDMAAIMTAIEHLGLRIGSQQRAIAAIERRLDELKAAVAALSRGE